MREAGKACLNVILNLIKFSSVSIGLNLLKKKKMKNFYNYSTLFVEIVVRSNCQNKKKNLFIINNAFVNLYNIKILFFITSNLISIIITIQN